MKRQKTGTPFFALAPMDDITDEPFRQMLARYGKPDVVYTEFVSADGLMSEGRERLMHKLKFSENERPIVAQIFGAKPENIRGAAELVAKLGFDGVDINMGCPDRAIMKQGAGAALIKLLKWDINSLGMAREIIRAAKEGVVAAAGGGRIAIPVSVKTRLGVKCDVLDEWLPELLAEKPAAIIIHCRTAKEMSEAPAHWERIADAVKMAVGSGVVIVGNGDVRSADEGKLRAEETGADGIMIGRAAIGNPFVFSGHKPMRDELLSAMVEHAEIYEKIFCSNDQTPSASTPWSRTPGCEKRASVASNARLSEIAPAIYACPDTGLRRKVKSVRSFEPVRKHLSKYCSGFRGAKGVREKILQAKNAAEVKTIVESVV